jgi:hypothetical protein
MTDTAPPPEPPPAGTASTAIDAGQARDSIESAARGVFVAALLWYALHGDDDPGAGSLLAKSSRRLARAMWWARPRLSSSKPPSVTHADRDAWVDKQVERIMKGSIDDAAAHYDTVFKRMRREDPHTPDSTIRSAFRLDHAWSDAAARSAATRLAAETAMDMQPDVDAFTGEPHHLMWISRGDPKVRALHRDLHGRVRPPGTPFHTWPTGQELRYPGDPGAPIDAWINCRCAMLLVPSKDAAHAEAVFEVPDADFDVPIAASGYRADRQRAEHDLRAEKLRGYTVKG